jgi:DNA-binding transcriptional LysR family regulator
MDFRIRQLEYFLVLADKLNFGRAATALNIAQPTLSFQIKALETTFGANLFDRTQRQVRLTAAGLRLRDHAKRILELAQEAMYSVEEPTCERLTISCGPVGQYTVLPSVLRELRTRHPNIALTILTLSPEQMKLAAVNGTVDMLLMTPDWQLPGMQFVGLRAEKLSAVLPESHPAARTNSITLEEFCKNPVLVVAAKECHKHKTFVFNLLEKSGLSAQLVEAPSTGGIQYAMVAAGLGVALAAGSIARANFPGVKVIPFDRVIHNMELGMMWHKGNESQALLAFRQVVTDVIAHQEEANITFDIPAAVIEQAKVTRENVA